jgi:hypothetical protein
MNADRVRRFPLCAKDSEDRDRHPRATATPLSREVSPHLAASLEGWATSPELSFETPRKSAAPQDDGETGAVPGRSFGNQSSREIVMSRKNSRLTRAAIAAACTLPAVSAFASQGPGGGMGTASDFTQVAMAILVYGAAALIVGTGLIGALRRY